MAKQLNVNLAFTADSGAAKRELQSLQSQLTSISKMPASLNMPLTKQIQEASVAAMELKTHLTNATNVQTGSLDFSKLNQSIKTSGTSLSEYGRKLQAIGPDGQKAFMALARSVSQAEIPIRRSNKLLTDMAVTLKNTARWQISSSVLHGFMGAVSSAYHYAQDLDESLNNIRIVTSASSEEMAKFAEQANKAAKSLNTTTTEYTNASLIYFQQGLDENEVAKRTAVTIKMANAAGESAEKISDQLTAVWNNFYDGSKSLEYYADVMTALGAATASSTDEIAGGLEKFAAVADTIGLSYEYAASALATITSNTRQSEEVVGTALKTIFARIQGLNLGETLDDGTTLNKYSEALNKVGISIFNQNGEIKKMDAILDEMGLKWQTLAKDQQIALAQTVAGVRQYNQLVSLMDNWNNGDNDSMKANLNTAYNATGTLTEQAEIAGESWEAARDRVTAAAEAIYASLLDEDFFIGFLNVLEDILTGADRVIDSMGGLKGVLSSIGVIATKVFSDQISQGLRNMVYNLQMSTEVGRNYVRQSKVNELEAMGKDLSLGMAGEGSEVGTAMRKQYSEQIKLQAELAVRQDQINETELSHIQQIMDMRKALGDQVIAATEKEVAAKDKLYDVEMQAITEMGKVAETEGDGILSKDTLNDFESLKGRLKGVEVATVNLKVAQDKYNQAVVSGQGAGKAFKSLENAIRSAGKQLNMTDQQIDDLLAGIGGDAKKASIEVENLMKLLSGKSGHLQGRMSQEFGVSSGTAKNIAEGYRDIARAIREKSAAEVQADKVQKMAIDRMKSAKGAISDWATGVTAAASTVFSLVSILNAAKGAFDALTNPDLSGWEKFTTVLSSLAMVVMMTVSVMSSLSKAIEGLRKAQLKKTLVTVTSAAAEWLDAAATKANEKAKLRKAKATDKATKETTEDTVANLAHAGSEKVDEAATKKNIKAKGELSQSFNNLGKSALNWVKANGSVIGGVALIAAGIAVAVGAIAWGVSQYNRFENEANEAAVQADKAAEAYQKVSDAYNQFTGNLSAYEDAQSGLEGLTKGTLEYREAILKANEAAIQLLNTYDDLTYTTDADGLITIDQDSLIKVQEQQMQLLKNAQMSSQLANQNVKDKRLAANSAQFQRDNLSSSQGRWANVGNVAAATGAGAGAGALVGAGIGMLGGPITAAAGAIIGALAGLTTGISAINAGSAVSEEEKALNKLAEIYSKEGNARFASDSDFEKMLREDLKLDDEALIQSLVANREGALQLVKELAANTAQTRAMNESMIMSEFGEDIAEKTNNENLTNEVAQAMGANLSQKSEQLYEDKWADQLGGKTDAEIQKLYAEAMGWNVNKIDNHSGNKATYYDDKGNVVAAELDDEVARRFLAQQEALKQIGGDIDTYIDTIQSLVNAGNNLGEGIGDAISSFAGGDGGNLSTLTNEQFNTAKAELSDYDEETGTFSYNGVEIDDAKAKTMGYESAEAFYDAFEAEIGRINRLWKDLQPDIDFMASAGLDEKTVKGLSLETAQALSGALNDINLGPLGEAGGKEFVDGLNKMLEQGNLNTEEKQKALTQLANIDWSNWDAMEQAEAIMESFGVEIDSTSAEWIEFTNNMRTANGAVPDFTKLKSTLIEVSSILQDLDFGSIISDEDYQKLVAYNDEWKKFFILQSDGSRKFVGDSSQMLAQTRANIEAQREELKNRQEIQKNFANVGWGYGEGDNRVTDEAKVWKDRKDVGTAQNLKNADGATQEMLELLGYTDERIQEMIDQANSSDKQLKETGQAALAQMYDAIYNFSQEKLDQTEIDLDEMMASTATNVADLTGLLDSNQISTDAFNKQLTYLTQTAAESAESLAQLQGVMQVAAEAGGAIDYTVYADNLIRLAEQYDNCTREIEEYQRALANGEDVEAAEEALEVSLMLGEAAEKYGFEAKELEVQAKQLAKEYNLDAEAAAKLAVQNQRMNKGIITLAENWKDWSKALKSSDKTTLDWAKAAVECTAAIADLVGASEDLELPEEFFNTDNMALLEAAMNGDIDAINRLGAAVASEQVKLLQFNDAMASLALETMEANGVKIDVGFDFGEQFEADKQYILDTLDSMKAGSMEAGTAMGDDWVAALNRMALATGMSVEEMNSILGAMGVQAKVETTYVKQPMEVPTYIEHVVPQTPVTVTQGENPDGTPNEVTYTPVKKYSVPGEPMKVEGFAAVAQISTEDNPMTVDVNENVVSSSGPSATGGSGATYTGNRGSVAPSTAEAVKDAQNGGGGGGDSKPAEKIEKTKKEDVVDRYKELEDALDDVADALEDASKQADRLYGKARIDKLKQMNGMIQQEIGLLKNKMAAAKQYLAIDKQALEIAAQKAGVSFSFDGEDNITNYTQEMEKLYEELRAAQDAWNADYQNKTSEEQQEYEETIIQPIQDKIDELKEAIAAYEETRELIEDLENQIDDKFYEWQDNNYEILHYELEIEIEINDLELEYIDYYLNKITDDFYSMAEAAQYMNNQIPIMTDSLGQYENFYNEITAAYAAGEISQAAYVEGMQESYSAILDQLSALNDLDKEMMHYYKETLDAASEELSYYTDQMEHLTSVLEHYRNIVELVNGEFDYESIGTVLEGQATTLKNELEAATEYYQMLLTEKADAERALANATDEAERELLENELKAITTKVNEAQEEMLSKTEEWAEAQKAIMENAMAQAAHQMEKAFTDGMGFDALNDSLDRLNSYADEYLTKTNQIYETQTLINTAQKAIDKTTNEAAKARLKSYQEEIQSLQEKNKLSNLELEIAKAKYDVLLAEIALEEAQNAKATVRLQRDNEGNYGYVYTADQEAISQAEQDLMDAENALYNIGLEGANEYGQKLLELQQQLADQLIALEEARAAGQFATDAEYYAARDQLIAEYTDLFTAYSEQYTTALGVDAAIQEEAWVNAYDEMIKKTGDWQSKVTYYTEQCENSYEQWRDTVESESEVIDSVLNDLESEVKDVTDESTALKDEVVNKVIPAMKNQLVSVRNVTSAYAQQRAAIQQLISYYEQLTQSILAAIQAQAGLSDSMGENTTESSTDDFDTSIDYSKRMYEAWQAKDMEAYEQAKKDRNTKISLTKEGDYGVSTARLDAWIKSGGGYDENGYFTDEWLKKHGYATGGYTGAWGPEGRLAWVHEKELMLNPEDTVNFLNATHLLRDIVDIIDINALRNQVSVLPYLFGNYIQGNGGELQQHVQIEAHFPGVTDRNEIEEAFNNLVNTASQYANRKH